MNYFCSDTIDIWKLVGSIVTMLKIIIPAVIVVLAIVDLGKAAVSSKEDEMKKAFSTLIRRLIAGAVIFFIPTIVNLAFGLIESFNSDIDTGTDYSVCTACIAGDSAGCVKKN